MRFARTLTVPLLAGLAVVAFCLAGCGGGSSTPPADPDPGPGPGPVMDHTNIVLKDRLGDTIQVGSTAPYSPRQTCGTCHDIDSMANGYHFQQGRTDKDGTMQVADNFFGDGRTWLKSDGMYGKW